MLVSAVVGVSNRASVLLVLRERPTPEVVNAEAEDDHLQGIALLSAGFTPSLEHVAKVIEVAQGRLGGEYLLPVFLRWPRAYGVKPLRPGRVSASSLSFPSFLSHPLSRR